MIVADSYKTIIKRITERRFKKIRSAVTRAEIHIPILCAPEFPMAKDRKTILGDLF